MKDSIIRILNDLNDLELISVWHYPSAVFGRLLEQSHNYKTSEHDFLNEFGKKLLKQLEERYPKYRFYDNKIAIEFRVKEDKEKKPITYTPLYLGWCDNIFCVGVGVYHYDGMRPTILKDLPKQEEGVNGN